MNRREFLHIAAVPLLMGQEPRLPQYQVVTPYKAADPHGIPGQYKGQVVRVHADKSIEEETEKVDAQVVRRMVSEGMKSLTGDADERDAWARFINPQDVVGIKVNCSGAPDIMSCPELVADVVANLVAIGLPPRQIYIYERFLNQMNSVGYEDHVAAGVNVWAAESERGSAAGYDPGVYVEANFFGEEDTRSSLVRLVSEKLTKIINLPNMKEHQAAGVTGCLKNIAYGHFSNVDRSHRSARTNTYSFIGTLAAVEPIPSRTVLHIMDGLRGVWHAGPFSTDKKFRFFPKKMMFGTDPVAMDRLLIDIIEEKRRQENAPSIFDRSRERLINERSQDANLNQFIREPGHIEYAAGLGLGTYDIEQIKLRSIEL